jgi:diphosphomevalonate decarboxylase
MQHAIQNVDFNALGSIMETNSDRLYHVMKTSLPVIDYRLPKTHTLLSTMIELRKRGLMGYATLDAGPNVKILTYERHVNDWIQALQQLGLNDHIVSQVGAGPDVAISH